MVPERLAPTTAKLHFFTSSGNPEDTQPPGESRADGDCRHHRVVTALATSGCVCLGSRGVVRLLRRCRREPRRVARSCVVRLRSRAGRLRSHVDTGRRSNRPRAYARLPLSRELRPRRKVAPRSACRNRGPIWHVGRRADVAGPIERALPRHGFRRGRPARAVVPFRPSAGSLSHVPDNRLNPRRTWCEE